MINRILSLIVLFLLLFTALAETEPDPNARFRGIPTLEMEDGLYRLNRRLTTVLLIGVDKTSNSPESTAYRSGGQADFLVLLVVNDAQKRISAIQINRDTMVPLTVLNVLGEVSGTRTGQICLSYAYGPGGAESCDLTADAVSALLNDTPINYCISMNMDGIAVLNDALGGVTVTLDDDFSAFDPIMTSGQTLTLNGMQAHYYVRSRLGVGDESNISRLVRQRNYMSAAVDALKKQVSANKNFIHSLQDSLSEYLFTDLSRGALYNLGDKAARYEITSLYEIEGEAHLGESGFVEFYRNEAALDRLIADLLYEKVG